MSSQNLPPGAMAAALAEDFQGDLVRIVLFEPVAGPWSLDGAPREFAFGGGGEFRLPSEPVLAPGHKRFATADLRAYVST